MNRAHSAIAAAIVVAGSGAVIAPSPAVAAKDPWQLSASFEELRAVPAIRKGEKRCTVVVAGIKDERRDPKIVGVLRKRAVYAPSDAVAWGEAVLNGLNTRGFIVSSDAKIAADVTVMMTLQTIWVTENTAGYSSNAVARIEANGAGNRIDTVYRGRVTRTSYWSAGSGVAQSSIDGAWSKLLDALAADLKPLCPQPSS